MRVPRCLFLSARDAVEAIDSFAPRLSGVFREISLLFGLFNDSVEICERTKRVRRIPVIVVKPLQNRTEDGMFGLQAAFALLSPISRL